MRKSRLSHYKQNKLIKLFVAGVTARTAAELVGVNKRGLGSKIHFKGSFRNIFNSTLYRSSCRWLKRNSVSFKCR